MREGFLANVISESVVWPVAAESRRIRNLTSFLISLYLFRLLENIGQVGPSPDLNPPDDRSISQAGPRPHRKSIISTEIVILIRRLERPGQPVPEIFIFELRREESGSVGSINSLSA